MQAPKCVCVSPVWKTALTVTYRTNSASGEWVAPDSVQPDADSQARDLLRKFAGAPGLTGAALLDRGEVAGYGYTSLEGHKGLIRDV
jgi:hypothetical protein